MIPYGRHDVSQADVDAVVDVLHSDFLTQGPQVPRFESRVAEYCGARHGVAANSATSALHVACLALGLGPGDWLWTSPITFVASANCALYCGAKVDFVDINPHTYTLDPEALASKLAVAETEGRLPKVVVPVHLCGHPCDMQAIHALSCQYGFKIIEDAAHAIGARYGGEFVGNCRYSDVTVFSFHPVKIITTGEGGIALTNSVEIAEKMMLYRSHGITRDPTRMSGTPDGPWYYEQVALGFNYRMTDIQAALGCSQLDRVDAYVAKRREIATRYSQILGEMPVTLPWEHPCAYSAYHLYVIRLHLSDVSGSHRQVFDSLRAQGIGVNVHYIPVHMQAYHRRNGPLVRLPQAERYYAEAITLPMYPSLTEGQQDEIVRALRRALVDGGVERAKG